METGILSAQDIVSRLRLTPHPEGGFYREVFRSGVNVDHPGVPAGEDRQRSASTLIYFLIEHGDFSAFHRVRSDETWHLYAGGPVELHLISQHGEYERALLALEIGAGFLPQFTIPANSWQAARVGPSVPWALCGCTVAPGFEFADFSIASRKELLLCYPACEQIILELTR